ncbi:YchJ family protein [Streptomyces sp. NPDC058171]
MSRRARSSRTPRSPQALVDCPCGSGERYDRCCGPFHRGAAVAPTAAALMRSRYAAYVVRDAAYLVRTWHPATRPPALELDGGPRWTGLEIVEVTEGSVFHRTGTVTFRASYTDAGRPGTLTERSRFDRVEGAWLYVDGTVRDSGDLTGGAGGRP